MITDDHAQCLDHGDFGAAVRAGVVTSDRDVPLGSVLEGSLTLSRNERDISIVDLTGVAAEDVAIAEHFLLCLDTAARHSTRAV